MNDVRAIAESLRLPAIVAPMTGVSSPALVAAGCAAGLIGSFPTSNPRSVAELDEWFDEIDGLIADRTPPDRSPGPIAANLIVGRQNTRLDDDVDAVIRHGIPLVITSVGSPATVAPTLRAAGCAVLADVVSERHAHKALDAGVDGLVLLSAGMGGHTGWANPFAFARAVRAFHDGPLVLAGGMSDGAALWAARCAGFDLAMFGTRFIATDESAAGDSWVRAMVGATMDDISVITAPNGVAASALPDGAGSAGHTVSAVRAGRVPAERVVDELEAEWNEARARTASMLGG